MRIEPHQTVAVRPEPEIATRVLCNCVHTPPEDRLVITGDLFRHPVILGLIRFGGQVDGVG
jgi:hypothetical protein